MSNVRPFPRQEEERRPLPFNLEEEQGLLGAILLNNDLLAKIDFVEAEFFFDQNHRVIFDVIAKLRTAGKLANPITVRTFLPAGEISEGVTMAQYTARLAKEATSSRDASRYAENVRDLYLRREAIMRLEDHRERLYDAPPDEKIESLINSFEDDMSALRPRMREQGEFRSFDDVALRSVDVMAQAYQNDGRITGMLTGLADVDDRIGGMQDGDFTVIGGRPGMGKSAFAQRIALVGAMSLLESRAGQVALFSLEMTDVQFGIRMLCEQAEVAASKVRRNTIDEHDFGKVVDVAKRLKGLPLVIDQTPRQSFVQVSGKLRALHRKKPIKLCVIDYLQLMTGGGGRRREENRMQEVTEITTGLKALAKELSCPIVALSQLSRQVEGRDDKRPQLSDLRESGSIEQDADAVLFCYREEYYLENKRPREGTDAYLDWQRTMERAKGRCEIIIGKSRHGARSAVEVAFDGALMRFTDALPEWVEQAVVAATDRPAREAQKREPVPRKLSDEAKILFDVLKALSITDVSTPATRPPKMEHPKGRLVAVEKARSAFADQAGLRLLGDDEQKIATVFRNAYKSLRAADIAFWCGTAEEPFVYVNPEKLK